MTGKQINDVVNYVLRRKYSCPHSLFKDCGRCLGRWIRQGIRKAQGRKA